MTKKIIAVDLDFPDQVEFYGPRPNDKHSTFPKRQKLRGKLRIITSQATHLASVEIRFKGVTQLYWRDPLTHSLLATRMHAWKTIRKSKHILLQNGTLPSGVTDLGFEITIPGYVCPSYEAEYMNVKYLVSAKIIPVGKFSKDIETERSVRIHKTLMPKDIAHGLILSGYRVPRCTMRGQRTNCLAWEFKVPKWVCLENEIEFNGILKSLNDQLLVDMIQVDVVQEENYHDDTSDQSRRHLIVSPNIPSTYLHPPLGSTIHFNFPLSIINKDTFKSTVQDMNNTLVKRDALNYSLESPFLTVRHFVRIMVYTRYVHTNSDDKSPPICLGLPIYITERIDIVNQSLDDLPTYQSVTRDGERLPDYMTTTQDSEENDDGLDEANHNGSQLSLQQREENLPDDCPLRLLDSTLGYSTATTRQNRASQSVIIDQHRSLLAGKRSGNLVIQERRLDDFWLVQ